MRASLFFPFWLILACLIYLFISSPQGSYLNNRGPSYQQDNKLKKVRQNKTDIKQTIPASGWITSRH